MLNTRRISARVRGAVCILALVLAALAAGPNGAPARAQSVDGVNVPGFWDPNRRFSKPDLDKVRAIRFVTELESPPFSFTAPDGLPAGFHVDLARAICKELGVPCTIQELKWDLLVEALDEDRGDAIIAPIPIDPQTRKRFAFTNPFLGRPGRFVITRTNRLREITFATLQGIKVGVVERTPHAAYLAAYFSDVNAVSFPDTAAAREALKGGAVDVLFSDALATSVWLNSAASADCCRFIGGAYTEPRFFGEGIAIAVDPRREALRAALDFALSRIYQSGLYFEIFLRYFPRGYY